MADPARPDLQALAEQIAKQLEMVPFFQRKFITTISVIERELRTALSGWDESP